MKKFFDIVQPKYFQTFPDKREWRKQWNFLAEKSGVGRLKPPEVENSHECFDISLELLGHLTSFLGQVSRLLPRARLPGEGGPSVLGPSPKSWQWSRTHHPVVLCPPETMTWPLGVPSCICPRASRRACAVGLVGGCLGAPWEGPWAPELFGLSWWRHCLIKADERRLFCFVKKIKKLSMREKKSVPTRKKKRKERKQTN